MPDIRCRYRLPLSAAAGFTTLDKLKEVAAGYPHLRPCPLRRGEKGTWLWIKREACVGCVEAKQETQE